MSRNKDNKKATKTSKPKPSDSVISRYIFKTTIDNSEEFGIKFNEKELDQILLLLKCMHRNCYYD